MELNEQQQVRLQKLQALREQGIDPYPARSRRTHTLAAVRAAFDALAEAGTPVTVAGRMIRVRIMGKASFAHLEDDTDRLQIYLRRDVVGEAAYARFRRLLDLGDIVEVSGPCFYTRTGEPTIEVREIRLLAKAISPPPEKWHGLTDVEKRYRQRYVDLMSNPQVREIFRARGRILRAIRAYLDEEGFLEVETPILQPLYGGAEARPFVTHHNVLDQDLYLRIAPELYLKRLLVGGLWKVYELGKNFRNEGVSTRHNPEFTALEVYEACADYERMMEITEQMLARAAEAARGSLQVPWQGHTLDFTPPWPRHRLRDLLLEHTGIDIERVDTLEALREEIRARNLEVDDKPTWGKLVDELFSEYVEPHLIQPCFVVEYPREISPLAKGVPGRPRWVERFEGFVGGMEIANAFTELNDPLEQEARFREQARARAAGDEEAHPIDEDFLLALTYGMPPAGGLGIGIDRLVMVLTDQTSIREVILFPHLRRKEG